MLSFIHEEKPPLNGPGGLFLVSSRCHLVSSLLGGAARTYEVEVPSDSRMAEMLFSSRVLPAVSINYDGAVATPGQPAAAAAKASVLLPRVVVVSSTPKERVVSGVGKTTFIDHIYSKCHGTDRVYISLHGELDPANVSEPLVREPGNSRFIHLVLGSDISERDGDEGSLDRLLFNLLVVGFVPCADGSIAWLDDRDVVFC